MRRGVFNRFNRGELDSRALLRDDVEKVNNSCELMENFTPQRLGPMQYRSGTLHISTLNGPLYMLPFIARTDDYAVVHVKNGHIEVWVDDVLVTKPAGNLTLVNEGFDTDLSGWTDASGTGSFTAWASGRAQFNGAETTSAKLWQDFAGNGNGVENSVYIIVSGAPMTVKLGTTGVDSTEIFEGVLDPGEHQLVFTPDAATTTITLVNSANYNAFVHEVRLGDGSGLQIPLPTAITDLTSVRYFQSADVMFIATSNTEQFKIERRGKQSWGVSQYRVDDGPFGLINNTEISLAAGSQKGNIELTATDKLFTPDDVGRLYKLISDSQRVFSSVSAEDNGTDSIRIVGVGPLRKFRISASGTFSGTIKLQRSTDDFAWQDVETYSRGFTKQYNDDLDNSILYYRLYVDTGDYTSGTMELVLEYDGGSVEGTCRVTSYTSPTQVGAQVLKAFGSTDRTRDWHAGEWGAKGKFPTAVTLYEGRLWWAGLNKIWGSVSDEYSSFDADIEGDSAPVRKTIGFGPVDRIDWLAPSSRLLVGVASDEISVRSNSFGNVLTQSNCNLKSGSTQGVAPIEPVKVDDKLMFVQRSLTKIMDAGYVADTDAHKTVDITMLHPSICEAGIVRIAAARQPETRIYAVLTDGSMRVHLEEPTEDVIAWSRVTTNGLFKDIVVLPGFDEDTIYVTVERNGFLEYERFSLHSDMVEQHFDSSILYENMGTGTLTGLGHLEGQTVGVWADGQDRGDFTVTGGQIMVGAAYDAITVGLRHIARYRSNKVSRYSTSVSGVLRVIGKLKRVVDVSLVMEDFWPGAVKLGPDFNTLEIMPEVEFGAPLDPNTLVDDYDEHPFEFNGNDDIDPRICIQADGPCVILGISYGVLTEGDTE